MNFIRQIIRLGIVLAVAACSNSSPDDNATAGRATPAESAASDTVAIEVTEIVPGLSMRMLQEGTGAVAEVGQIAVVHYTGWLYDQTAENNRGKKFDSSVDRRAHFKFTLGAGGVIRGWDEGVVGMKIGEVRELTIAPELAYGSRQVGNLIPPGSTLVFEVELADLKDPDSEPSGTP